MLLQLYNTTTGGLNPSALIGLLPGGAGTEVAGTAAIPGLSGPTAQGIFREALDATPTTPAIAGKVLVRQYTSTNGGGASFAQNTVVSQACARFGYGIVQGKAGSQGAGAFLTLEGPATALCTTGATAIVAGSLLGADGAGNLTVIASPTAGEVLAIAIGALAATTGTPTAVAVIVGGY